MQSTSWETLGWKKHEPESRLPGEISITSDMQLTPPFWQRVKKNSRASDENEREWKSWLKAQRWENKDHASGPITSWQIDGETVESVTDFILGGSKITANGDHPMDCSTPGLPVHHQLPELAHTHVHQVSDTIQPSNPLSSPSPPVFNPSQYQGVFQWVSSSHQVAKVLEFQLQHQYFQWIFRTDFL